MTSKDFRAIAAIIANLELGSCHGHHNPTIAAQFAHLLAQTNPAFDRSRFLAAAAGAPLTKGDLPRARDYAGAR